MALTPNQLLLGTWSATTYTAVTKDDKGIVIARDSASLLPIDHREDMTYQSDGTLLHGKASAGTYVYTPPTIVYFNQGAQQQPDDKITVTKLTDHTLVIVTVSPRPSGYSYTSTTTSVR